ncbi:hypothetical protein HMPREF9104_02567 [Lentilactobacillus kisonensis F0435]|uniref:Uncharacterized protein n=1 Tax=Lentilactobacillus kisonensis F0435 TaxID=797516 RepID=H1LIX5_9LACO|nr:hypothetical protein HMPREF9104_02567 [Lentilactobacillus kisonensis F0435]
MHRSTFSLCCQDLAKLPEGNALAWNFSLRCLASHDSTMKSSTPKPSHIFKNKRLRIQFELRCSVAIVARFPAPLPRLLSYQLRIFGSQMVNSLCNVIK